MKSSSTAIPGAAPARRIAELFLQGAATFAADHADLFDGVLIDLELAARPIWPNGYRFSPTPAAPWSGNSRATLSDVRQAPMAKQQ
jgi:hypothetical protein